MTSPQDRPTPVLTERPSLDRLSRRSFVTGAVMGVSSAALLAACGGSGSGQSGSAANAAGALSGKTPSGSLVLYKGPFTANETKQMGAVFAGFGRKYPKVKVTQQQYDWAEMDTQIPAVLLGGSPPDVIYLVDNEYGKWDTQGALLPLDSYVHSSGFRATYDAIPQALWKDATSKADGHIYGVPWGGVVTSCFFVNLTLLKKAGVTDYNSSYAAFRDAARKVQALGGGVHGFTIRGEPYNPSAFDWTAWIHTAGTDLLNDSWTKSAVNTPTAVETFQMLSDMINKDKSAPPYGSYNWDGLRSLFQAGKVGIAHDENTFIPILYGQPSGQPVEFEWTVASLPPGPTGAHFSGMANYGFLTIDKRTQNLDAAWAFVEYLASRQVESSYLAATGFTPVRTDLGGLLAPSYRTEPAQKLLNEALVPHAKGWQLHPKLNQMLAESQPIFDSIYLGKQTAAAGLKSVASAINGNV
jgi:multiple sugar transport system substrate-binding protein